MSRSHFTDQSSASDHEMHSDSEIARKPLSMISRSLGSVLYPTNMSMPSLRGYNAYSKLTNHDDNNTDDEPDYGGDVYPEFGEGQHYGPRVVRTGRQRKKLAARTKGGEFQTKRKKRRVYFCCISSEIEVQKLIDHLNEATDMLFGWRFELHNDVLHMYKAGVDEPIARFDRSIPLAAAAHSSATAAAAVTAKQEDFERASTPIIHSINISGKQLPNSSEVLLTDKYSDAHKPDLPTCRLVAPGSKEVFVYEFGAVVFWGFGRGEEAGLLKTIRMFITKGLVADTEFQYGKDDMAFVTSPDDKTIGIANDVITIPEDTVPKQRLAVSFAIAQSSVLSIFEARIEQKVDEYKYIPEALAAHGKVHLSERQLGMMIGEVFVIRHDVNLHTEILDTPDFFWKGENFESDYRMMSNYLEMAGRTEILNKRLDMLRELLDVLQQQMENAHAVKLEWIVIYLIVAEVVLQGLSIISKL